MKTLRCIVTGAVALAAGACQPSFGYLEIEPISSPPSGVTATIGTDEIELPVGIAIAARVVPHSDNATPYGRGDRLRLRAKDDDILELEPTLDAREWVFVGLSEGDTCIAVEINRDEVDCIDAEVIEVNL